MAVKDPTGVLVREIYKCASTMADCVFGQEVVTLDQVRRWTGAAK